MFLVAISLLVAGLVFMAIGLVAFLWPPPRQGHPKTGHTIRINDREVRG